MGFREWPAAKNTASKHFATGQSNQAALKEPVSSWSFSMRSPLSLPTHTCFWSTTAVHHPFYAHNRAPGQKRAEVHAWFHVFSARVKCGTMHRFRLPNESCL